MLVLVPMAFVGCINQKLNGKRLTKLNKQNLQSLSESITDHHLLKEVMTLVGAQRDWRF